MKRLLGVVVAALLVFSIAGQASAALFDKGNLTAVATDYSSFNLVYDLGDIAIPTTSVTVDLGYFPGKTWGDIKVAMFAAEYDENIGYWTWFSTQNTANPTVNPNSIDNFDGADIGVKSGAKGSQAAYPQNSFAFLRGTDFLSYDRKFSTGLQGSYAQYLADAEAATSEISLASFSAEGKQSITAYLHKIFYDGETVFQQGYTTITINEGKEVVPLPGAVYLLASGLVGLVAIRRRRNQA